MWQIIKAVVDMLRRVQCDEENEFDESIIAPIEPFRIADPRGVCFKQGNTLAVTRAPPQPFGLEQFQAPREVADFLEIHHLNVITERRDVADRPYPMISWTQ